MIREYSYYEVLEEISFIDNPYHKFEIGDIIRVNYNISNKVMLDVIILNKQYKDQIWEKDQKDFFNQLNKKARKITDLLENQLILKDIKEINMKRLDFKNKKLGYYKALNIMIQAVDNIAKEKTLSTKLKVYDDNTIGNKSVTSDCGMCSAFKDLNINRCDIEEYPCPFDKNSDKYINDIEKFIKSNKNINFKWYGCYHRCKLKDNMTIIEGKNILKQYKEIILKDIKMEDKQ